MADSSIARVIGVLTSPERAFRSLKERPTWLLALMILIIAGVGAYYLLSQRMDMGEVVRDSLEQSGREMTEDQLEQAIDMAEKFGSMFSMGAIVIGTPIFYLLGTLGIWVAVKLVGAELTFKQNFATFVHAQLPHAASAVLSLPAILSRDEFHFADLKTGSVLPSSLGHFAPEETSTAVISLLSSVDVFSIWALVLLIIGVATVGQTKRSTAGVAVGVCWVLFVLGKAGWAALFG